MKKNMMFDTKQKVKNLNGEEITVGEDDDETVSYGNVCANAVLGYTGHGNKAEQYALAVDLQQKDEVELSDNERELLIDALNAAQGYTALVAGQIIEALNQEE